MGCSSPGSHLSSSVGASELSHRQRVIIRLQDIGYTPTEALVRTDSMTQDELSYFADNPEAIKRSGVVVALFLLLTSQPSTLLHYALENAAHRFTSDAVESARESGQYKGKSECEPPDAKTFYLSWTPEELQEKLIGKQKPKLSKNERGKINTAISRIRKLVHFSDDVELVELDKETWERRTTIPFRYCRRTAD